jgi:hypothetical protein
MIEVCISTYLSNAIAHRSGKSSFPSPVPSLYSDIYPTETPVCAWIILVSIAELREQFPLEKRKLLSSSIPLHAVIVGKKEGKAKPLQINIFLHGICLAVVLALLCYAAVVGGVRVSYFVGVIWWILRNSNVES